MDTPIYDAVSTDQGWSPTQLRPPFDLDEVIEFSYLLAAENSADS